MTQGADLSGIHDVTPDFAEVSGRMALAQSVARRLITPRARLIDDPNYGFDLTQYVNDDLSPGDVGRIAAQVDTEVEKDERISSATTTITLDAAGVLNVLIVLEAVDGDAFDLTLKVDEVTASILTVQ